jgi:flagellar basal body-associated protein FliL
MQLEKKRRAEMAQRKGSTVKTIIQTVWLLISVVGGAGLIWWLNSSRIFPLSEFYNMGVPRAVPEWGVMIGAVIVIVIVMQMFFLIGFLIGSPQGRAKQGRATAESQTIDYEQMDYDD